MENNDLISLANRQNAAMNTIRENGGGYIAYVTAAHVIGPFGGDVALELQIGFETVRKQLESFIAEVEGWETTASMAANRTPLQRMYAWMAGIRPLPVFKVNVIVY